jgi:hypothetical protein
MPGLMPPLLSELRPTARGLFRSPAFSLAVLGTLALGIGANTAIYGVVRSVVLRPGGRKTSRSPRESCRLWPGENPIGKRLSRGGEGGWYTVIGVSANTPIRDVMQGPAPMGSTA